VKIIDNFSEPYDVHRIEYLQNFVMKYTVDIAHAECVNGSVTFRDVLQPYRPISHSVWFSLSSMSTNSVHAHTRSGYLIQTVALLVDCRYRRYQYKYLKALIFLFTFINGTPQNVQYKISSWAPNPHSAGALCWPVGVTTYGTSDYRPIHHWK